MMKDPDAVDEVELAELDAREVSAMELDSGSGDLADVAPRGLESIAELDSFEARGAEASHVMEEGAVSESELQHRLSSKALGIEGGHPLEELDAGVSGARRKAIPGLGERVRGLGVVVSHGRDEET
jgi:hypothetical protein